MRTVYKRRQCGKTTDLIKRSAETGAPMVVRTVDEGRHIVSMAKKMGYYVFPQPIAIRAILSGTAKFPEGTENLIVDDADIILDFILKNITGFGVDTLALVERNELGHEINHFGEDINVKYGIPD